MGTSKKIMLASLVSMMLALAFVIGLVPSHDATRSGAANGGERVDMVELLGLILGDNKAIEGSTLVSPVDGVVVKTPEDNSSVPEIPVPVQLNTTGEDIGLVTFVANTDPDAVAWGDPEGLVWEGDIFSDALSFPYAGAVDVSGFLAGTAVNTQTSVLIYALVNASADAVKATRLQYEATNAASDALALTIFKRDANVDTTDNGLPDDIFAEVGAGEIWVSNVVINGVTRTVLIANADQGAANKAPGTIVLTPNARTSIEVPNLDALVADGLVPNGESALIVVDVVDDLDGLIDEVDGNATPAAVQAWVDGVLAQAPGALTDGGQFIDISIVATSGAGFVELDDLSTGTSGLLSVTLNVTGLTPGINEPALYSYPTAVENDGGTFIVTNQAGDNDWTEIESAVFIGSSLSATTQTLSVFAPLNSGISISGVDTDSLPQNYTADITITGVFPTLTALNIAEAAAAYKVYVNGQPATFRDGDPTKAEIAITAYDGVTENEMYVTTPAVAVAGASVDLEIVDAVNPGNNALFVDAFVIEATGTISTSATGSVAGVTFALSPTNGPGLPAGAFFVGDSVAITATLDPTETVSAWSQNGNDLGTNANPVNVTVDEGLNAVVATIDVAGFVLNATAGTGGSVAVAPAQPLGGYASGTVVTLTATADLGFEFVNWTGANAGDLADASAFETTITMDTDKTVVANFQAIVPDEFSVTTAVIGIGGTAAVTTPANGSGPGLYTDGTVVTIAATADVGFEFAGWTVVGATAADASAETTTVTVAGANVIASATFTPFITVSVTGIAPNEAWLFGGVVATVSGTGLTDGTVVTIGGNAVTGFRAAENGTTVDVLIPASSDNSTVASFAVDVTASNGNGSSTLANGFTYNRYDTDADGVNYTAFIVDSNALGETVDVTLGAPHTNFGELVLPAIDSDDLVFGLARNAQDVANGGSKLNTPALTALGTAGIGEGDEVDNIFDFAVHLYAAVQVAKNTPPAGSAVFDVTGGAGLIDFDRPVDSNGNPVNGSSMLLTFPINGAISDTGLTFGDVGNGLTVWGSASTFDYASNQATLSDPLLVEYQSQILNEEVDPARTAQSDPAAEPNLIREARLYTLNGFSVRTSAIIPEEVADGVRLATASGTANDNTPSGPTDGGTDLRIISPLGGLGFVDRVEFVPANKALGGTVTTFTTPEGSNEFELRLQSPAATDNGIVDVVLYMKADPTVEAVRLERAYEYVAETQAVSPLWLLLLGILIAIIGLAAGGDSGGGGGGPCFIASAAYGTPMAAEVDTLRAVRDSYLLTNPVGTAFVDAYYHASPALADVVATSPMLATLVRVVLVPVIFLGKVALTMPALLAAVGLSLGFWFVLRSRKARKA
jgi:hypothetical protein